MKVGFVARYSEESFKIAAEAGLDCIEIGNPPESWFMNTDELRVEIEKVKELCERYGVTISSLLVSREIGGVNLRANSEERKKQLQQMARRMDVCKALGDDVVYCFTGPQGYDASKSLRENVLIYKEVYGPVAELASRKRVKVAFENCPGAYPFCDGTTLAVTPEAWELMFEALPTNYIGLEFDPSHLVIAFIDYLAAAEASKIRSSWCMRRTRRYFMRSSKKLASVAKVGGLIGVLALVMSIGNDYC